MTADTLRRAVTEIRRDFPDAGSEPDRFMHAVADVLLEAEAAYRVISQPNIVGDPDKDPLLVSCISVARIYLDAAS